jgi:hypothetical protein
MKRAAEQNDGWLNLTVHTTTEDGQYITHSISRALVDGVWSSKGRAAYEPNKDVTLTFAYDSNGVLLNGDRLPAATRPTMTSYRDPICQVDQLEAFPRIVRILMFNSPSNADGTWSYGARADSDIEIGEKFGTGDWQIGGSVHLGDSSGGSIGDTTDGQHYNRYIRTEFQFGKYHYYGDCGSRYVIKADDWAGGLERRGDTYKACFEDPLAEHTVGFPKGSNVTVDNTRAAKFTYGVDIGPLSVGSTSGYSTNVQMHWNMTRGGAWFCGRDDEPLGTDPGPGFIWNTNR